jgi:hypothetical protein
MVTIITTIMVIDMTLKVDLVITTDKISYRRYGKCHRNNGPAVIYKDRGEEWYHYGYKHW